MPALPAGSNTSVLSLVRRIRVVPASLSGPGPPASTKMVIVTMRIIFAGLSQSILAATRLWNHRLLMSCLLLGLVVAVGLLSSVPLYADAAQNKLLQGELTEVGTYRPPFAFLWRYVGAWHGSVTWEEYTPIDAYLYEQAPGIIDLPVAFQTPHVTTDKLRLFPSSDTVPSRCTSPANPREQTNRHHSQRMSTVDPAQRLRILYPASSTTPGDLASCISPLCLLLAWVYSSHTVVRAI